MLERGDIRVVTDSVWALEDVKEAYEKLAGMHAKGKILVHINKEPDHPTPGRG
jgi:NADPH:quinone reductase-like Zn-dependent oxidoreductase